MFKLIPFLFSSIFFSNCLNADIIKDREFKPSKSVDHKFVPFLNQQKSNYQGPRNQKKFKSFIAYPGTNSHKYSWLSENSTLRAEFIKKTKNETLQRVSKLKDTSKFYDLFIKKYNNYNKNEEFVFVDGTKLILKQNEFNQSLTHIDRNLNEKTLFATDNQKKIEWIFSPVLNSELDKALFLVFKDGSIDNADLYYFDLKNESIEFIDEVGSYLSNISWKDQNSFYYSHKDNSSRGSTVVIYDTLKKESEIYINKSLSQFGDYWQINDYSTNEMILSSASGNIYYKNLTTDNFFYEDDQYFFSYDTNSEKSYSTIFKLKKENEASEEILVPAIQNYALDSVEVLDEKIVTVYSKDRIQLIKIFDLNGNKLVEKEIPSNLQISFLESSSKEMLTLNLSGMFEEYSVNWNYLKEDLDLNTIDIQSTISQKNGLNLSTKIEYFPSKDGEMIPARIIFDKNAVSKNEAPVLIEAYGGFLIDGYLGLSIDFAKMEFLKKGGIIVGTGIRGGNERGYEWYKKGSAEFEQNTLNDLIAIAHGLVKNGTTTPSKIALMGTSNGGYVVASAALQTPESFGLIIPINGVQDQLAFTDLDRFGIGWADEFLNPFETKNFYKLSQRSPVELGNKKTFIPEFFIVNGENDTRVNKSHSYKLKAVLDEKFNSKTTLLSVDHAGHWPDRGYLIGETGIKNRAIIWAKIFDYFGLAL